MATTASLWTHFSSSRRRKCTRSRLRLAAERSRLVAEPSGALALAAIAFRRGELAPGDLDGPVVGVVSGGNVDPALYRGYLEAPLPG